MEMTATIARIFGVSIFAVLEERAENVLDVYEYVLEKAENNNEQKPVQGTHHNDGFWDF